jgi:hypothetical protein
LDNLYSCLLCPLCNKMYNNPVTLPACAHSFCQTCINDYSCDNYNCPVCTLPITLRGSRAGKFDKTNPQIETVVNSFSNICKALNEAPEHWWKEPVAEVEHELPEVLQTGCDEAYSFVMPRDDDDHENEEGGDEGEEKTYDEETVEEEVMEFQPEEEEEEIMEFQPDATNRTTEGQPVNLAKAVKSPESMKTDDDDATAHFPIGATPASAQSKRSCSLPSQSPDCSVIPFAASQMTPIEEHHQQDDSDMGDNKENEVDNQALKTPKISNLQDEDDHEAEDTVRIFVASQLSSQDRKLLKNLERETVSMEVIDRLDAGCNSMNTICLCGNAEMETGDGWLVGPTYHYLEAMARGIPIMHTSSYLKNPDTTTKHRVIGIGSSSDWMGPQRAVDARGKSEVLFLDGYTLRLVGDFDTLPKRAGGEAQETIYSKDRLGTLLKLCGANLVSDSFIGSTSEDTERACLIRPNPHSRDWRAARKEVDDGTVIVCANWLLESLADYHCKEWTPYTQTNFKKT